jgi:hypothetical protein
MCKPFDDRVGRSDQILTPELHLWLPLNRFLLSAQVLTHMKKPEMDAVKVCDQFARSG